MEEKKNVKNKDIKVLILNDSLQEKELMVAQLYEAGYQLDVTHVKNETQFTKALDEKNFDIVLSGFKLPGFDAFGALELCQKFCPETPFICVCGSIDEEKNSDLLKNGAVDYVLKQRLERLPFVLKNALTHSKEKAARKLAIQRLKKSENRFSQVAQTAGQWIWEIDTNGLYTYVSPVIESMLGYTPDEVVDKKYFYDSFIPEKREDLKKAAFELIAKKESFKNFENSNMHKDGNLVIISTNGSPIFDNSGNLLGYQGVDTDITEQKRSEELIKEIAERAKMQRDLIAQLTFDDSVVNSRIDEALKLITAKLAATLQVDRASVWMLSEDQKKLRRLMLHDADTGLDSQIGILNTADIPSYFEAMRKDGQIDADDTLNDMRTKELTDDYLIPLKISSLLDSAIQQDGELIGVLSVEHRGSIRKWHSDEKSFLFAITNIVAQLYANAERRQAELDLRESEARFRNIMASMNDMVFTLDKDQRFTGVFGPWVKNEGLTPEFFLGKNAREILGPEQAKVHERANAIALQGKFITYEWSISNNEGDFYYQTNLSPIYDENQEVEGLVGVGRDITKIRKTEKELQLLNRAVEASSVSVIITDAEGTINYVNPYFTEATGYSSEEVLGKNPRILKSGKQSKTFYKELWNTIKSGKDWSGILHNQKKSGELFWEMTEISPIHSRENGGITHFVAIKEDITELLKKEDELNQSLKEKEILLSEIHHRVKNNLAVVSALLQLQSEDENNSEVKKRLDTGISKIKTISNIHEQLYKNESFSRIDISNNIKNLTQDLVENLNYGKKIQPEFTLEQIQLNVNQSVPLSLIINEVIVNALKHAFIKKTTGKISINLSETDDRVKVKITDNGTGIHDDLNQKNISGGMLIIDILTQQLKGQYQYKRIKTGTEFSLTFEKSDEKGSTSSLF